MTTDKKRKPLGSHDAHTKLLQEAEAHLDKGDMQQAVEKAWGAVDHRVREIARKNGWQYETHTDSYRLRSRIAHLTDYPHRTRRLLTLAVYLITDYHPEARTLKSLRDNLYDVEGLLEILDGPQFIPTKPKR